MLLYAVVIVLLLALLGALLHPFALLIDASPVEATGLLDFLSTARSFIANFLLWGLFGLLALMTVVIVKGRMLSGKSAATWESRGDDPRFETRARAGAGTGTDSLPMKVAVAIVAYNEADAISRVVEEFNAQSGVVAVIVVDNNSRDDTASLAGAAGARVVRETRQGYGYACIRGLQEALKVPEADVVVLTEGDGTFVAGHLSKFQAYIHQADMVVGTRVVPGLVESGSQMDPFFTWGNIFASALLRFKFWDFQFLGAARLSDLGCTFRAIRREALEEIIDDLEVGGVHFSPHMIMAALSQRLSVIEIPITFRRRIGESKGASRSIWRGLQVGTAMILHIVTYKPPRRKRIAQERKTRQRSGTK